MAKAAAKSSAAQRGSGTFSGPSSAQDAICDNCGHERKEHAGSHYPAPYTPPCPPTQPAKKKTEPEFEDGKCTKCGHDFDRHMGPGATTHGPFTCPPLPPPKQVSVDEAVAAKGGKPSSIREAFDLVSSETEKATRLKVAEEHFERRPGEPLAMDLRIDQLKPYKDNPRGEELGDTSGLEKVMEVAGFLGVLMVRRIFSREGEETGDFEVIVGNRRLQAAKRVGLKVLPCDVYELTDVQALELNVAEQTNRLDLTPLAEGEACRRLVELSGYSPHQAGEKFGKSASWVTKRIQLAGIAPELRKAVAKGGLSVTLAQAIAAIPTQQAQVKTYDALQARPEHERRNATAESDAQWIRETVCLPLADATWKLTDAELTEAGPCSTCPKNSSNDKAPGLFDSVKSKPLCLDRACFEDKALAAWLARTAKQKAAGAKVLSLGECRKLFARGNDLGSASRYVEASDKPPKDKQGRTWAELVADVPEEHRPQLHLAQDNGGKLRQLYVSDKALEAVATHLKARWAKSVVEEAQERKMSFSPEARAQQEEAEKEARLIADVRRHVEESVINGVASVMARDGLTLPAARLMAGRLGERALEKFAEATGRKKLPKDWLAKGATISELLALIWLDDALDELCGYDRFTDEFLALAKSAGANVDAMTKAQLATAKAEAEKANKP